MLDTLHVQMIKLGLGLRARRDERGATAVEYGLMVALIAIVIITAVSLLGGNLKSIFNSAGSKI